jgi:hypothetical protein
VPTKRRKGQRAMGEPLQQFTVESARTSSFYVDPLNFASSVEPPLWRKGIREAPMR